MASLLKGESLVTLIRFVQKLTSLTAAQRDPGLKGVAWSNPFVAPCSSDGIRECGALASDFQQINSGTDSCLDLLKPANVSRHWSSQISSGQCVTAWELTRGTHGIPWQQMLPVQSGCSKCKSNLQI
eukprot:scaffold68818_cov16-Tisochrysis_lutea.AAC.1